jgi:hypothetical protein
MAQSSNILITADESLQLNVLKAESRCIMESRTEIARRVRDDAKNILENVTDRLIDYNGDNKADVEVCKNFVKELRLLISQVESVRDDPAKQLQDMLVKANDTFKFLPFSW